jgi:small subunit ribosomal protein S18
MAYNRPKFYQKNLEELECLFCKQDQSPDFKDSNRLARFLSGRGKILARGQTGVCAAHQRQLTRQIKRARFLGQLPFLNQVRR